MSGRVVLGNNRRERWHPAGLRLFVYENDSAEFLDWGFLIVSILISLKVAGEPAGCQRFPRAGMCSLKISKSLKFVFVFAVGGSRQDASASSGFTPSERIYVLLLSSALNYCV